MQYQWDDTCYSVEQRSDSEHELLRQMLDSTSLAQLYVDFDERVNRQQNVGDGDSSDVTSEDSQLDLTGQKISPREHIEILTDLAKRFGQYSEEIKQKYFDALIEEYANQNSGAADIASGVNHEKGKHKIVLDSTLKQGLKELDTLLSESLASKKEKIQMAALKQVVKIQKKVNEYMSNRYRNMADHQRKMCKEENENVIAAKKAQLKEVFMQERAIIQKDLDDKLQQILFEKNLAIEKTNDFLECRTIAAQLYVALKEKEEKDKCKTEIEESLVVDTKKKNKDKKIKKVKDDKTLTTKISNIMKKLQQFTEFCIKTMPGHGGFFIDIERIILMQLNEVCDNINAESIFEAEETFQPNGVTPKPEPYYLFSDTTNQETDLLLKNSIFRYFRMPAIVVGRRLIYSTDDDMDMYSEVLRHLSNSGDQGISVKCTNSDLSQLELESTILQITQKPEVQNFSIQCNLCRLHCCSCGNVPQTCERADVDDVSLRFPNTEYNTLQNGRESRSAQPKLGSNINFIAPQRSRAKLLTKKQLKSYLPTYMRSSSSLEYAVPTNTPFTLESISDQKSSTSLMASTRNTLTQCTDSQFELFCEDFFNDMNNILERSTQS